MKKQTEEKPQLNLKHLPTRYNQFIFALDLYIMHHLKHGTYDSSI